MLKKIFILFGFIIFNFSIAQNKPTSYIFFNERIDKHFSLTSTIDSFEIATEDGLTYTFVCNNEVQKEKSIANIKFTNRNALKPLVQKATERLFIIVKKVENGYLYFTSQLQVEEEL